MQGGGYPPAGQWQPGTPAPQRPRSRWAGTVLAGVAALTLALGSGVGGALIVDQVTDSSATTTSTTNATTASNTTQEYDNLTEVVAAVSPSIVTVTVSGMESSLGSGIVVDESGLIVTNYHVVESGGTVSVQFADGTTAQATVVGHDSDVDIALVQATGVSDLTPATLNTDTAVTVGDTVLAFGSPLGLEGTVTSGIVSAVDRLVDGMDVALIQTDAAINSGNSGGALVNTAGQVIGINVAIATTGDSTGSIGIGFAIPADTVVSVISHLTAAVS